MSDTFDAVPFQAQLTPKPWRHFRTSWRPSKRIAYPIREAPIAEANVFIDAMNRDQK